MKNKRLIVAGILIIFMVLVAVAAVSMRKSITEVGSELITPNAKEPPVLETQEQTLQTLELSDEDNIICEKSPSGNTYGGISGKENDPPNGTTINQELTKQYGRSTATGVCGTYWYIVGWWFNASEMAKLPSETIMYGVSPYAITEGSGGSGGTASGGNGDNEDGPIAPVPEVATVILVAFGIFVIFAWKKIKK